LPTSAGDRLFAQAGNNAAATWLDGGTVFVIIIPARELHVFDRNGDIGISNHACDHSEAKLRHHTPLFDFIRNSAAPAEPSIDKIAPARLATIRGAVFIAISQMSG
jgi:hypothetical protein